MARILHIGVASLLAAVVAVGLCADRGLAAPRAHVGGANGALGAQILRLQNAERRRRGLRSLHVSRDLTHAARRHARYMVRRHYFGHFERRGDVVDRVGSTRYGRGQRYFVEENLYWWNRSTSPAAVVRAWMGSAVHRANVLGHAWHQFGIAVILRSPFGAGITAVGVYGTRLGR